MDYRLIKYFGKAPNDGTKVDVSLVVNEGYKRGYLVHPDCCTKEVLDFLRAEAFNPNSTFYKNWEDVTSKDRFELLIDQICHYMTVAAKNAGWGNEVYCPNGEPISINYKVYKQIMACTAEEMYNTCIECLQSGIALADETLAAICDYAVEGVQQKGFALDLDSIANRDAMCILCTRLGLIPTKGENIVRYLFYQVFEKPMPIQSRAVLGSLHGFPTRYGKTNPTADLSKVNLTVLTTGQKIELARVFHRYKKFLLGLKYGKGNSRVINQVRRLAKKYHKPMVIGFWENFTNWSKEYVEKYLNSELTKLDNNFKIIRLIQMLTTRKVQNARNIKRIFHIRNGKTWVDKDSLAPYAGWWDDVIATLQAQLVANLEAKRNSLRNGMPVYVKYPTHMNLTCPVSEKKFVGNLPFGTNFPLADKDSFFGIYWKNEWGTYDFDLSMMGDDMTKLGWNSDFYNKSKGLVFSGDMTDADPEATEMFYLDGTQNCPNGCLMINRYRGEADSRYRLFFGSEKINQMTKGYMVDPNNIHISEMCTSTSQQQVLARIQDNRVYLMMMDVPGRTISYSDPELYTSLGSLCKTYLPLQEVLEAAGFITYTDKHKEDGIEPTFDLTDPDKDTLIKLFS